MSSNYPPMSSHDAKVFHDEILAAEAESTMTFEEIFLEKLDAVTESEIDEEIHDAEVSNTPYNRYKAALGIALSRM